MHDDERDTWPAIDFERRGPHGIERMTLEAGLLGAAARDAVIRDPEDEPRPSPIVLYELGSDQVTISGALPFSMPTHAPEKATSCRFEIARSRIDGPMPGEPSATPSCLVLLNGGSATKLLLDLAAASVSTVAGSDTAIDETLYDLARQAALGACSTVGRVLIVGRELRPLADESSAVPVVRVEEALEVLRRLESSGRSGDGTLATLVVVSREAFRATSVAGLVAYAARRPWLCVLLPAPVGATKALVATIGGEHSVYLRASTPIGAMERSSDSLAGAGVGLDPPVEVSVLGRIEVRGASGSLERRPKLTELVVYLAMHPEGATSSTWQNALWPERRVPAQTVANRLSEARGLLGMELDGRPRLRRSAERHWLAGVTTDWEHFRVLADQHREAASWRSALELVRGRPFDDLQQGHWTVFEGFVGEIETSIVDCALRYGEHCLERSDPDGASWAAQRALRANPYDERLYRLMMRAADAAGNRSGVEAIYRNLVLILDIEGDGSGAVHPETAALYERLSGRRIPFTD